MAARLVIVASVVAIACGDGRPSAPGRPPAPADASPARVARHEPSRDVPVVEVDGRALELGPLPDELELPSIEGLPPVHEWARILAFGANGRRFASGRPLALTGERTMKLARTERGYDFRVVEARAGGASVVRNELPDVVRVEIHTLTYEPPAPASAALTIIDARGRHALAAAELDAMPRVEEPLRSDVRDVWALRDVVGTDRLAAARELVLRGRGGDELVIPIAQLSVDARLDVLKRNRRGAFNYRQWIVGDAPQRGDELRDVVELELRP